MLVVVLLLVGIVNSNSVIRICRSCGSNIQAMLLLKLQSCWLQWLVAVGFYACINLIITCAMSITALNSASLWRFDCTSILVYLRIGSLSYSTLTLHDNRLILYLSHKMFLLWCACVLQCEFLLFLLEIAVWLHKGTLRFPKDTRPCIMIGPGQILNCTSIRNYD
jgi:hypothetical protein